MPRTKRVTFNWKLSTVQSQLFQSDARFRVAMMGRRAGKNELGTAAAIDYALRPSEYDFGADNNPVVWWVGPTHNQAKKYGFHKLLEKLPDVVIDGSPKRSAPFEIPLYNGGIIECYSFDRPESLQGAGVDLIVIDEAAYMAEDIWDNDLRPMLLDSSGGAMFISKPIGQNWFHECFQRGQSLEFPEWDSVHGTSYDNPFIDHAEIEKAKRTTPEPVFRQQYLADPEAGGRLLTLDMLSSVPADRPPSLEAMRLHVGVDIGVTMDPERAREQDTDYWAAALVGEDPHKGEAFVLDIVRARGQTPDEAAQWLKGVMHPLPTNQCYIEAVQAQRWFLEHCREVGLSPIPVEHDRPKEERLTYLSVPFSNGNVMLVERDTVDWSDFKLEWSSFPNGSHDDQLDALEMALRQCSFVDQGGIYGANPYEDDEDDDDEWKPWRP